MLKNIFPKSTCLMLTAVLLLPGTIFELGANPVLASLQREPLAASIVSLPAPVEFREDTHRGLQIKTWVNNVGPFVFMIDTGAGMTLLSQRVAGQARVVSTGRKVQTQGAAALQTSSVDLVTVRQLALGGPSNLLPNRGKVGVTTDLPAGVDGILDPAEAYQPLGFILDFPASRIGAFDPMAEPPNQRRIAGDGAQVRWLTNGQDRRPYVRVNHRWNALIDTGAQFGLAVPRTMTEALGVVNPAAGQAGRQVHDVNGQGFQVQRVRPLSIHIESFELNRIPTDILTAVPGDTPLLLGRDALRPFRIRFDVTNRLIEFEPVPGN
ncbi:MAG: retroviral-like aspartic protease family protein [Blastocatellia bacterium]|nr:retroviral-like aspartic protease family protein [Blastocatellia bacterium]